MPLHILYWLVASCASLSGGGRLALRPAASFGDVGCSLEAAPWNLNEFKVTYISQIYSNLFKSPRIDEVYDFLAENEADEGAHSTLATDEGKASAQM